MKINRKGAVVLFFVFTCFVEVYSQENTTTSGGDASGSGGTISFTVGQIFFNTSSGDGGVEMQGIQQPFEIFITGVEEIDNASIIGLTFPNPTSTFLYLKIDNIKENAVYQLYDINGKLLESRKIDDNLTTIQMTQYAPSVYFLKVLIGNEPKMSLVKSFKIIKN